MLYQEEKNAVKIKRKDELIRTLLNLEFKMIGFYMDTGDWQIINDNFVNYKYTEEIDEFPQFVLTKEYFLEKCELNEPAVSKIIENTEDFINWLVINDNLVARYTDERLEVHEKERLQQLLADGLTGTIHLYARGVWLIEDGKFEKRRSKLKSKYIIRKILRVHWEHGETGVVTLFRSITTL